MIRRYNTISVIYGGKGKDYALLLSEKINAIVESDRYPLKVSIVMEQILTRELLADVINLFKNSEFCVAFLTKEDHCVVGNDNKTRLRQNVVFELGMAIMQLGRERCILLSDFDIHSMDFEMPSDMNSLEIKCFNSSEIQRVMEDVITKIVKLSQDLPYASNVEEPIRYNNLLLRTDYYIDYENIFLNRPLDLAVEGTNFIKDTVLFWLNECLSLPRFDERCVYLFERVGFLSIFGDTDEVKKFIVESERLVATYSRKDIQNYNGRTDLLNFVRNLVIHVIEYTSIKTIEKEATVDEYKRLLHAYLLDEIPEGVTINPLIMVAYYDYLGLIYNKLYQNTQEAHYLDEAAKSFARALSLVPKVDMALNIWAGFLYYNIARVYAQKQDLENATRCFEKAIEIRRGWLKNDKYNITVRNALSYEYFLASIGFTDMKRMYNIISSEEAKKEYEILIAEINTYIGLEERMDRLMYIKKLLAKRAKE